jgi:hypothetical protein
MKRIQITIFLLILTLGMAFLFGKFTNVVNADRGTPLTISATYNSNTGQLNVSGTYEWVECEPGEQTNILGFALFVNNGTPADNDANALDGSGMHLANGGNPCTTTPDSWTDNSHTLATAPKKVCMAVYDVRADDSADPGGIHSLIGAGANHNTDNSWDSNGNNYSQGSCTAPVVITSSPTPTSTPIGTATPSVDVCANIDGIQTSLPDNTYHFDLTGKNCLQFSVPGIQQNPSDSGAGAVLGASTTGGQVLGTSTMANAGAVEDALFNSMFTIGSLLTSFGIMRNGKKKN